MLFERRSAPKNHLQGQMSLSLFDDEPALLPPSLAAKQPATPTIAQKQPQTLTTPYFLSDILALTNPLLSPLLGAKPEPGATAPRSGNRGADGERTVLLLGTAVPYQFRRSARKSIGFMVSDDGLTVTAPRWVRVGDVEDALQQKAAWIVKKLQDQQTRQQQIARQRIEWRDGGTLPFIGAPITLALDATCGTALFDADSRVLRLPLPSGALPAQVRDTVQAWLQRQAKRLFAERVVMFAERLRVPVRAIKLSSASTRWGTATADGDIRLNWRLIHFALPIIDYVAAHEVSHLREMNHSPEFWATVGSIFPEFEAAKLRLKTEPLPLFD